MADAGLPFSKTLAGWRAEYPAAAYIAPFLTVLLFIALFPKLHVSVFWEWPIRVILVSLVCYLAWPREISPMPQMWISSALVGIAVFFLWIAPDVLAPGYRGFVLFSNPVVGHAGSSLRPEALSSAWVLAWRTVRASTVVPAAEELFWRAFLMRWLINNDFQKVALGTYAPLAFWITALLFAAEHGPYWDVGLVAGIVYNFWMIRTRSVADCVLMHAVTNVLLSAYVIAYGQWQYWQ